MYLANEYDCERMQLKYYSPDMHRNFVLLRFVKKELYSALNEHWHIGESRSSSGVIDELNFHLI